MKTLKLIILHLRIKILIDWIATGTPIIRRNFPDEYQMYARYIKYKNVNYCIYLRKHGITYNYQLTSANYWVVCLETIGLTESHDIGKINKSIVYLPELQQQAYLITLKWLLNNK